MASPPERTNTERGGAATAGPSVKVFRLTGIFRRLAGYYRSPLAPAPPLAIGP